MMEWLPHGVLATLVTVMAGIIWRVVGHAAKAVTESIEAIKKTLDAINKELGKFATLDQLGRMGDRFDARVADLNRELGAVRDRCSRLEGRNEER